MGVNNDMQVLSGYFNKAKYYEWDKSTNNYKDPIEFRFKQADNSIQGVSSGGKKVEMIQEMQGRNRLKYTFSIKTIADLPFKPHDNIEIINEDVRYTVKSMYEDYKAVNSLANLQFPRLKRNKAKILLLGEQ